VTRNEKVTEAHRLVIQRINDMREEIDKFARRNIDNDVAWAEATGAYKSLAALEQIAVEQVERFRNR